MSTGAEDCTLTDVDVDMKIPIRRIPSQNIVSRLLGREMNDAIHCGGASHLHATRLLHTNVFPNATMTDVEKPPCFLRKFSLDGRYMIAFSAEQTSLEIYAFQGSAAAQDLLQGHRSSRDGRGNVRDGDLIVNDERVRGALFSRFFRKHRVAEVSCRPNEHLNRECSLFTEDARYVIVGSASAVPDEPYPHFFDIFQNNESVTPNMHQQAGMLEDYSLHLIELDTGRYCDRISFKCDKIYLSHNQGLYLYRSTLAVLSVQHQTIHVYHVLPDGRFMAVRKIGRFCFEDDPLMVTFALSLSVRLRRRAIVRTSANTSADFSPSSSVGGTRTSSVPEQQPFRDPFLNSLKQRLLAFLLRMAQQQSMADGSPSTLLRFYQRFDHYRALRMWKMQLLDDTHLLIRYAGEDVVTLRAGADGRTQQSLFVVYNMTSSCVVSVYENSSEEFLQIFENFGDLFRNAIYCGHLGAQFSLSSNAYARQLHQHVRQSFGAAFGSKLGAGTGHAEAVKHLLAQLPISAQSYSSSPYLDLSLFSYEDKSISMMERPRLCGDYPIRFFARDSGLLRFKIYPGRVGRVQTPSPRWLVAFTFHPFEPFAISVQRVEPGYVVNFHIRHCPCEPINDGLPLGVLGLASRHFPKWPPALLQHIVFEFEEASGAASSTLLTTDYPNLIWRTKWRPTHYKNQRVSVLKVTQASGDASSILDECGWIQTAGEGSQYLPIVSTLNSAPKSVIKLVKCSCAISKCKGRCSCGQLNLPCTELCACKADPFACENVFDNKVAEPDAEDHDDIDN